MKFVIDAGHGGFDPGACGNGLRECDLTYDIATVVSRELIKRGHVVILTRPDKNCAPKNATNKNAELSARYNLANASGADVFCSIHINAGGGTGAEAIVYKVGNKATAYARKVVDNLKPLMGVHGTPVKDLAQLRRNLAVVAKTKMPSLLVEVGFIDNASDAAKIKSNIDRIGCAIAAGLLLESYDIIAKPTQPMKPSPTPKATPQPKPAVTTLTIDGKPVTTDIILTANGVSYAPIRTLAESIGYTVEWDSATRTINLTKCNEKETDEHEQPMA
jgi:N-acetylmuramoyl-L-alanine amidase